MRVASSSSLPQVLNLRFFFFSFGNRGSSAFSSLIFFLVSTSFRWYRERNTPNGDKNQKATTYK